MICEMVGPAILPGDECTVADREAPAHFLPSLIFAGSSGRSRPSVEMAAASEFADDGQRNIERKRLLKEGVNGTYVRREGSGPQVRA